VKKCEGVVIVVDEKRKKRKEGSGKGGVFYSGRLLKQERQI